jgi:hypothetical protein
MTCFCKKEKKNIFALQENITLATTIFLQIVFLINFKLQK